MTNSKMKPHHDMGGDQAGPITPDRPDDPIFAKPWHKRVLGLTVAGGAMGAWSIDTSRFWRESLPKTDYQSFTYYEKWLRMYGLRQLSIYLSKGSSVVLQIDKGVIFTPGLSYQPIQPSLDRVNIKTLTFIYIVEFESNIFSLKSSPHYIAIIYFRIP